MRIRILKQTLNYGLIFKIVERVIKFKQKAWIKSCIYMNTELRKNSENDFKKTVSSRWITVVSGKPMENVTNIKLVKTMQEELFGIRTNHCTKNVFFLKIYKQKKWKTNTNICN